MNRNIVMNNIIGGISWEIRRTIFLYRNDALGERERANRDDVRNLTLRFLSMTLTLVPLLTLENLTMNEVTQSLRDIFRLYVNIIRDLKDHVAELQRETSLIENDIDWALEKALLCHFSYQEHEFFTRDRHQFHPKVHRTIDSFISNEARSFTGFTKSELQKLFLHWRIPYNAICDRQMFYGEESMIIFLYLPRKGHFYTYTCGAGVFRGDPRSFYNIIFWIVDYMYKKNITKYRAIR